MVVFTEPGRHYARSSNPHQQQQRPNQQYAQPHKNNSYDRRQSLSKAGQRSGQHPHLPKGGASGRAKRSSKGGNDDFLRTPDAGESGSVFKYFLL